jgi:hypothetical protein
MAEKEQRQTKRSGTSRTETEIIAPQVDGEEAAPQDSSPTDALAAGSLYPDGKPFMPPAPTKVFDPRAVERARKNMHESILGLTNPATAIFSVVATNRLGQISMENGTGNDKPTRVLLSFSGDNQFLFIMPCLPDHPKGVEVRHRDGKATINFWAAFAPIGKEAPVGKREYYAVEVTPEAVVMEDLKGKAIYVRLQPIDTVSLRNRKRKDGAATTAEDEPEQDGVGEEPGGGAWLFLLGR